MLNFARLSALILIAALTPLAAQEQPNFIVIFADDLGYGDLSSYGARNHQTPHLDRMADEGIRFTDFYVPMPFCAPSRAALLTGRYPFHNTVVSNPAPDAGLNDVHLPLAEVTIAEALKPHGYATAAIGKWHLGHMPQYLPRKQGFDEYYGILYSNDMRPVQLIRNEEVAEYPVVQSKLTGDYTRHAIDFIERNRDQPFFLYLPYAMPHKPLAASEAFYTPEAPGDLYSDVLRELDWSIGQIFARLKQLNLDEKTLVVFTSDNGPWYGGSTAGLRGMKGLSFDGGIRVPFIVRWPGHVPPQRVSSELVASIDIFPTLMEAAGVASPAGVQLDGISLLPLLSGKTEKSPREDFVAMAGARLAIVRSGRWKLHVIPPGAARYIEDVSDWVDPRGPDGVTLIAQYEQAKPNQYPGVLTGDDPKAMMLFDLEADRAEQHDVAAEHPDIVARLKAIYDRAQADVPPPPRPGPRQDLMRLMGGELRYDRLPPKQN